MSLSFSSKVIYETFAIFGSIVFLLFFERGLNAIIVELTIIYHFNVLRVFQFLAFVFRLKSNLSIESIAAKLIEFYSIISFINIHLCFI
jgi:hypothetical protein